MRFLWMFALCFSLLWVPSFAEETVYMRVVARSDETGAQQEKMLVRNTAIFLYPDKVKLLEKLFPDCRVTMKPWQPDKHTAPAQTVYITIGQGLGQNWWGVLFPDSVHWASRGEGEMHITFPIFEWLLSFFRGR